MASQLPDRLKSADIQRFALRAAQLEKAKPAIAYWCEYWIVNQILARNLHSGDAETLKYTTTLMDKLEQIKAEHATDETIVDDTAGQAYVEQFGLETFERADRAVRADKVSKQTADTFLAAATFLELLNIWGEPGTEIHAKIRYAKWNAVRIMKAIKEGKDPNESNPKPEPAPEEELQPLDPNDPEVRQLQGQPSIPHQPSVEEVPDEGDRLQAHIAGRSLLDQSLHPSQQPSPAPPHAPDDISGSLKQPFDPYPRSGFPYNIANSKDDVSPIEPEPEATDEPRNPRAGSIGGGYFPEVPPTIGTTANDHQSSYTSLPTAPPISPNSPPYPSRNLHHQNDENGPARDFDAIPSVPPPADADADRVDYTPGLGASPAPQDFYKSFPSPAPSSPPPHAASHAASAHRPPPPASPFAAPLAPAPASFPLGARARAPAPASVGVSSRAPPPPPEASRAGPPPGGALPTASKAIPTFPSKAYNTDDASVAAASKHARFAISALTFDDVGTAVRELRAALGRLGAE